MLDTKSAAAKILATVAGGGIAGLIDVETPTTLPLGVPVSVWASGGAVALGYLAATRGKGAVAKAGQVAMDLGTGGLAFGLGTAVVNRVATAKQAAAVQGVAGVAGNLPAHQAANAQAISNGLRAHIARMQQAA